MKSWTAIFKNGEAALQRLVLCDYQSAVKNMSVASKRSYKVNLMQYTHSTGIFKQRNNEVFALAPCCKTDFKRALI